MPRSKVPGIVSLIYTQNPFYLISACLFVYGLKLLFRSGDSAMLFQRGAVAYMEPWGLMSSFAAVTVLMAVTAILVVRLGKVWEDARSLVLIVLLMLLAISVSLDELLTLLSDSDHSRQHLYVTFLTAVSFAIGICEVLIRCLRIQFRAVLRLPLYGFILLFFLWPGLLLTEVTSFSQSMTRILIAVFPTAAGGLTLCLLPAVRRGSAAVRNNGTPWAWPLFPWTPFVFIAVAVCFRSYFLTMSYDVTHLRGHYWDTIFGVYQLVPFFLAVAVLLLEMAHVEKITWLQHRILVCAPLLLVLSNPWLVPWFRLPAYRSFTLALSSQIASPVFLTLVGLMLMYGWAWLRGIRYAQAGFCIMAVLSSCIAPQTYGVHTWQLEFTAWPLLALAAVLIVTGFRQRRSLSFFTGALMAVLVVHSQLQTVSLLAPWRSFLTVHCCLVAVIVAGSIFRDSFAEMLREAGPVGLLASTFAAVAILNRNSAATTVMISYFASMTMLAFVLWKVSSVPGYYRVALLQCGVGTAGSLVAGSYTFLRADLPAGFKHVVMAMLSFLVAVFISVLKSGLSRRIRMWWVTRQRANRPT